MIANAYIADINGELLGLYQRLADANADSDVVNNVKEWRRSVDSARTMVGKVRRMLDEMIEAKTKTKV